MNSLQQLVTEAFRSTNEGSQKTWRDLSKGDTFYLGILTGIDYVKISGLEAIDVRTKKKRKFLDATQPVVKTDLVNSTLQSGDKTLKYTVEPGVDFKFLETIK